MSQIPELADLRMPLQTIKLATHDFSEKYYIGKGGFGRVYKGQLSHPRDQAVAVKRLDENICGQGRKEFLMEIRMLASYKHPNIVSLIGFCDEDSEKALIYKHEANGSLDKHLADTDLTWEQRLRICLDAARGLKYLHEDVGTGHRVIHRDIKSSNILLDHDWKAKIADFGLSKIGLKNQGFSFLVSSGVGTYGYVDPQYMKTGLITKESDVYAFGVVLFEVLCGRPSVSEYRDNRKFLSTLVKLHYENRNLEEILFLNLRGHMKPYSVEAFSRIAYRCLNEDRRHRPTMGIVVKELEAALNHQVGGQLDLVDGVVRIMPCELKIESMVQIGLIKIRRSAVSNNNALVGRCGQDEVDQGALDVHGAKFFDSYGVVCELRTIRNNLLVYLEFRVLDFIFTDVDEIGFGCRCSSSDSDVDDGDDS
ncbi:hypothetical protein QVD17_07974 [Tagetes erecta]|uniref:non-specific serine/threonine protein kinase n=1 Tax=Tagetes erecta TaxID=13708 RepID=A0AAD8KZM5_TARER|nr:hypothetical protein QVD17_07974 [Tagetes erecta]